MPTTIILLKTTCISNKYTKKMECLQLLSTFREWLALAMAWWWGWLSQDNKIPVDIDVERGDTVVNTTRNTLANTARDTLANTTRDTTDNTTGNKLANTTRDIDLFPSFECLLRKPLTKLASDLKNMGFRRPVVRSWDYPVSASSISIRIIADTEYLQDSSYFDIIVTLSDSTAENYYQARQPSSGQKLVAVRRNGTEGMDILRNVIRQVAAAKDREFIA